MAINSMSAVSHGLSGMVSGMDTQSMVDAMLSGTQSKIDSAKAQKATLTYKQSMYREMFSTLKTFQSSYLSFGNKSGTNMLSTDFYNTMTALSKASSFKATAGTSAVAGKTVINSISQLAKAAKVTSGQAVSGAVKGKIDLANLKGQKIQLQLDGVMKNIDLPGSDGTAVADEADFRKQLQASIDKAFGNGIKVGGTGSEITFEAIKTVSGADVTDTSREFTIMGTGDAMKALGMPSGASNKVNLRLRLDQTNFAVPLAGNNYEFSINGTDFKFSGSDNLGDVITKINGSKADVKVRYSSLEDKFVMESTISGKDVKIDMKQDSGNLLTAMFGEASGNKIVGMTQTAYGDISGKLGGITYEYKPGTEMTADEKKLVDEGIKASLAEINRLTLNGDHVMKFMVDGKEITATIPKRELIDPANPDSAHVEYKSIDDIVNIINNTQALKDSGVQISLGKDIVGNKTGAVTLEAPTGKQVFVDSSVKSVFGLTADSNAKEATATDKLEDIALGNLTFDIAIPKKAGSGGADASKQITVLAGATLAETAKALQDEMQAQARAAGYTDAEIAGIKVEYSTDANDKNSKGAFRIFGVEIPMDLTIGGDSKKQLFGTDKITLNKASSTAAVKSDGQNAKLQINGIDVERNTNEFTVDGMSYELKTTFNDKDNNGVPDDDKAVETIDVTRDTTKTIDGVAKFMEDYNKMIDKMWTTLKEEANYKDYPPLTDKQKESMSEKEVEQWEAKSKEGLLRGDATIEAIAEAMRRALNTKPAGAKYSLAEMGITTSYDMVKGYGGMLKYSDTTGDQFKKMVTEEPGEFERLFSNSADGLGVEINNIINGATTETSKRPEDLANQKKYSSLSLANLAGRPGFPDTASTIYKQMRDINSNLANLSRKYQSEYDRYWKQFNNMEQMINQMNSQSSWLAQQLQ